MRRCQHGRADRVLPRRREAQHVPVEREHAELGAARRAAEQQGVDHQLAHAEQHVVGARAPGESPPGETGCDRVKGRHTGGLEDGPVFHVDPADWAAFTTSLQ